ncbi:hypothetical protein EMPG_14731 [Blastomyces silverae]|uniref:Uncharacterized protein n=1 Tax=Blastomyces silverae TaxID=2060906 RepID=A0A0H1BET7_9EURO|nr:hypothetical protein EMPG_14731 [Blastomyces silverae]
MYRRKDMEPAMNQNGRPALLPRTRRMVTLLCGQEVQHKRRNPQIRMDKQNVQALKQKIPH